MAANGNSLSYDFKSSPATCTGIPPCERCHLLLAQVGLTFFGSQLEAWPEGHRLVPGFPPLSHPGRDRNSSQLKTGPGWSQVKELCALIQDSHGVSLSTRESSGDRALGLEGRSGGQRERALRSAVDQD